jgi:predicted transcriptional regulator
MAPDSTKRKILEAIERLPNEASVEDAMERLYFLGKVERGLAEADAGETVPHADAKNRAWSRNSGMRGSAK